MFVSRKGEIQEALRPILLLLTVVNQVVITTVGLGSWRGGTGGTSCCTPESSDGICGTRIVFSNSALRVRVATLSSCLYTLRA
jgi:hypothetical protein